MASYTYQGYTAADYGSTVDLTAPTRSAGDLLVLLVTCRASGSYTTPTGWELIDQYTTGTHGIGAWGRIATNDSNDNIVSTAIYNSSHTANMICFTGDVPTTVSAAVNATAKSTNSNTSYWVTSVTPDVDNCAMVFVAWKAKTSAEDAWTVSGLPDNYNNYGGNKRNTGGTTFHTTGYYLQTTATATTAGDITLSGGTISSRHYGLAIAFTPIAGELTTNTTVSFSDSVTISTTAVIPTPVAQWDVNTRGREDDDFYEHIGGAPETSTGSPSLDTSSTLDGLDYNGTTAYTMLTRPTGLSTTFMNSDYTMAIRLNANTSTNPTIYKSVWYAGTGGNSTDRLGTWVNNADGRITMSHASSAANFFTNDATDDLVDNNEHVLVMTRSGNDFVFYQDGVSVDSETVAASSAAFDYIGFSVIPTDEDAGNTEFPWMNRFDGTIFWAAIWDSALRSDQVALLDDEDNPFITDGAITATDSFSFSDNVTGYEAGTQYMGFNGGLVFFENATVSSLTQPDLAATDALTFSHSAVITNASGPSVETNKSIYDPDENIVCTIINSSEAPISATLDGVPLTIQSGATNSLATLNAPTSKEFAYDKAFEFTRFGQLIGLVLNFPTEPSFGLNITITPAQSNDYFYTVGTPPIPTSSQHEIGTDTGDEVYFELISGYVQSISTGGIVTLPGTPGTPGESPVEPPQAPESLQSFPLATPTHYVSPSGTGTGTFSNPMSIVSANIQAAPGRVYSLRGGTYITSINPYNSGTSSQPIIYQNYPNEIPVLTNTYNAEPFSSNRSGAAIRLASRSYIIVNGIHADGLNHPSTSIEPDGSNPQATGAEIDNWVNLDAASYCRITGCNFIRANGYSGIRLDQGASYNIVENCFAERLGSAWYSQNGELLEVRDGTHHNIIRYNQLRYSGHGVLGIKGDYNVAEYNVVDNRRWDGPGVFDPVSGGGNRIGNIQHTTFGGLYTGGHLLYQRNTILGNWIGGPNNGFSGEALRTDGININSNRSIVRFNDVQGTYAYSIGSKLITYSPQATSNHIYNNNLHEWNQGNSGTGWQNAIYLSTASSSDSYLRLTDNIYKNNSISLPASGTLESVNWTIRDTATKDARRTDEFDNNSILNNSFEGPSGSTEVVSFDSGTQTVASLQTSRADIANNNSFGQLINSTGGTDLTYITSASNSAGSVIRVNNPDCFFPGIPELDYPGDTIRIARTGDVAVILAINYTTKDITLDRLVSWTLNDAVSLEDMVSSGNITTGVPGVGGGTPPPPGPGEGGYYTAVQLKRRWFDTSAGIWSAIDTIIIGSEFLDAKDSFGFSTTGNISASSGTLGFTTDKASYNPGDIITCFISSSEITPSAALLDGVSIPILTGASNTQIQLQAPAKEEFIFGGDHYFSRFAQDLYLVLTLPSSPPDTLVNTIKIEPTQSSDYFYTVGSPANPAGSQHETGTVAGDEVYFEVISGSVSSISDGGVVVVSSVPTTIERRWFDISAESWSVVDILTFQLPLRASDLVTFTEEASLVFDFSLEFLDNIEFIQYVTLGSYNPIITSITSSFSSNASIAANALIQPTEELVSFTVTNADLKGASFLTLPSTKIEFSENVTLTASGVVASIDSFAFVISAANEGPILGTVTDFITFSIIKAQLEVVEYINSQIFLNFANIGELGSTTYSFPSTGLDGAAPDPAWYNIATQFGATVQIQGDKLRYTGNGHPNAAFRAILLNGNGIPLKLKDILIQYTIDFIQGSGSNAIVSTIRQSNFQDWRGEYWFSFATPFNGYSSWGWQYGRGQQILHRTFNRENTTLSYLEKGDPSVGYTYIQTHEMFGPVIKFTRTLQGDSDPWIDQITTDSFFSDKGYVAIGAGGGDLVFDIYDISITDYAVAPITPSVQSIVSFTNNVVISS